MRNATRSPASLAAEAAFRARLKEFGAELLEPAYLGSETRHHVRCAAGHDCYPRPNSVRVCGNPCRFCARKAAVMPRRCDSLAAEAAFRRQLADMGAELLEPEWRGVSVRHHVRCTAGHDCHPTPLSVRRGQGICLICVRRDPGTAAVAFRAWLAGMGAEQLTPYVNSKTPVHVRCAGGHDCYVRPARATQGEGICRACAGVDPVVTEAAFRASLAALGAQPMYEKWLGTGRPHRARCAAGHDCSPRPADVQRGSGICRACAGQIWDAFYVVASADAVKFGITSGDPRARLRVHAALGYTEVARLATGLPGTIAPDTETAIRAALALAGERPVRGREYFDVSCLALILDVADSWLGERTAA